MMIFFIYFCFVLFSLVFLYYPNLYGGTNFSYSLLGNLSEKNRDILNIEDNILSIKASLKDIHMENQIGKLADSDFQNLRSELLKEWSHYEDVKKSVLIHEDS